MFDGVRWCSSIIQTGLGWKSSLDLWLNVNVITPVPVCDKRKRERADNYTHQTLYIYNICVRFDENTFHHHIRQVFEDAGHFYIALGWRKENNLYIYCVYWMDMNGNDWIKRRGKKEKDGKQNTFLFAVEDRVVRVRGEVKKESLQYNDITRYYQKKTLVYLKILHHYEGINAEEDMWG